MPMLASRITIITTVIIAVVNFVVLVGWLAWSTDKIAGLSALLAVLGGCVQSWFDPNVPVGQVPQVPPSPPTG